MGHMTRTLFKEKSFDIIACIEVLEHVKENAVFIQNVHRILKKRWLIFYEHTSWRLRDEHNS